MKRYSPTGQQGDANSPWQLGAAPCYFLSPGRVIGDPALHLTWAEALGDQGVSQEKQTGSITRGICERWKACDK